MSESNFLSFSSPQITRTEQNIPEFKWWALETDAVPAEIKRHLPGDRINGVSRLLETSVYIADTGVNRPLGHLGFPVYIYHPFPNTAEIYTCRLRRSVPLICLCPLFKFSSPPPQPPPPDPD